MLEGRPLSAEQVLRSLDERRARRKDAEPDQQTQAYRRAASVLAAVRDPDRLRPVGPGAASGSAGSLLQQDWIVASGRKFDGHLMLDPGVRRAALKQLGSRSAILEALEANPGERSGLLQIQFERYLRGEASPLEAQTYDELECTHQVVLWLDGIVDNLPAITTVEAREEYLRLLQPFEALAGDAVFRGRVKELDDMRGYVGVVSPESLTKRIKDRAFKWLRPRQQPALSVWGPGGVGKSALIMRFMLEHSRLEEAGRIPFAYLDFDRPSLDVTYPLSLCVEMIRQLHVQFPGIAGFDELRSELAGSAPPGSASVSTPSAAELDEQLASTRTFLAELLGVIESALGPRPYVIMLDTFEEVQYRGESRAHPFWDLLAELQQRRPFLRVVVSGRAPVTSLRLAGKEPNSIEVGALDREAALSFLGVQGVGNKALADRLFGMIGGMPLSLKLAAELVRRRETGKDSADALGEESGLLLEMSDEVIQGQLYARVLDHIKAEQVRRLAHPGLVLRRITPDVILNVLNGPCSIGVRDIVEASALQDELRRETSLVLVDDSEGALVHRPDLRRVMLKLLAEREPAKVEEIRRAAVRWYRTQTGRRARAEESYHTLQLGDLPADSMLADPEVKSSIQASISELPAPVQVELAGLGFLVAPEILERASLEQRDAAAYAMIEERLPFGPSAVGDAERQLSALMRKLERPSVLFRAAARVAQQQEDDEAAAEWIERGLSFSVPAGLTVQTLELVQEKAWLFRDGPPERSRATLNRLRGLAERQANSSAELVHALLAASLTGTPGALDQARFVTLLREGGPELLWGLMPAFSRVARTRVSFPSELLEVIGALVLRDDSTFQLSSFRMPSQQAALEQVLVAAASRKPQALQTAFVELCTLWPYRVLFVKPPFGNRVGTRLTEA